MTYKEKGPALGSVIKEVFILSCFAPGFIREMSLSNEDVVFKLFFLKEEKTLKMLLTV